MGCLIRFIGEEGLWKIIHWIDDPLGGDCGISGKIAVGESRSWGQIKAYILDKQTIDDWVVACDYLSPTGQSRMSSRAE